MDVFENRSGWARDFDSGWRDHLERTGSVDWTQYRYVRNRKQITAPGIDLASSRLLLVTTAGAYLHGEQPPFDASSTYGDYTVRTFPSDTPLDALDYAHDHYDHAARREDPRVNLPLGYLTEKVAAGDLGGIAREVLSFSGYQPDARAVVEKIVPEVIGVAEREEVQAALLVPV